MVVWLVGLTPCRQLRPSSRRELVSASNSHVIGNEGHTLEKLIKVCTAQLPSKTLKSTHSISRCLVVKGQLHGMHSEVALPSVKTRASDGNVRFDTC